jgi:very-short-patch-repair endonuclease
VAALPAASGGVDRLGGAATGDLCPPDGQLLVAEIDGAVHLRPQTWWDDMARQNELVIGGSPVLRFSFVDIRLEPDRVVDQLRRVGHAHQK